MGLYWSACYLRNILWQKFDVGKKLAVIRYMEKPIGMPPNGTAGDTWNPILTQMFPDCGPAVGLNIASSLECQADWLMHHNPAYLLSYPSNLSALADIFEERGLKLPKLRRISTVSEVLSPEMRLKFNRVWNVPTSDIYTCEEVGYLAIQCPEYDHYHVQSANVFLEVVDLDGNPCPLGVEGRVLITSLHNFATPLIRYEVGDYAVQGGTCPCGRGSPVLKRILGRSRNRLILPDGTTEFPYFGGYDDWIAVHNGVAKQFQYVQRADGIIEKKMVMNGKLTPEQEEKSKQLILRSLGHPFEVVLTYHDNLPRSARGKFEEFVCAVQR